LESSCEVGLGFSERKHLPVVKVGRVSFPLWKYRSAKRISKMLSMLSLDDYAKNLLYVEFEEFEKYYLPPFSLRDKIVLDLGACCGETAYFFLQNGAKKVVCVEPDSDRAKLIQENKKKLNLNIEILNDFFCPSHLLLEHDFIKCDIEGAEINLIPYVKELKPCVVEIHGSSIEKLFKNSSFHIVSHKKNNFALMTNY
jgi:16S rRNA G966 N2-methylase RsmD